jgi:hypothetical protein
VPFCLSLSSHLHARGRPAVVQRAELRGHRRLRWCPGSVACSRAIRRSGFRSSGGSATKSRRAFVPALWDPRRTVGIGDRDRSALRDGLDPDTMFGTSLALYQVSGRVGGGSYKYRVSCFRRNRKDDQRMKEFLIGAVAGVVVVWRWRDNIQRYLTGRQGVIVAGSRAEG